MGDIGGARDDDSRPRRPQRAPDPSIPDSAVRWAGRFESYRQGHGFLRWMFWDASMVVGIDGPDRRGAYVAGSQVTRFHLTDGDIVHAVVRPPRTAAEQLEVNPNRDPGGLRDETSWALLCVVEKKTGSGDKKNNVFGEEGVIKWHGRFEGYQRGHGFLRALDSRSGGSSEATAVYADGGPDRGVYVALTQVQRFGLRDGDVVGALVRPPRTSARRFQDKDMGYEPTKDEQSWSLVRVLDVNHVSACERDRGKITDGRADPTVEAADEAFEWTGVIEMWNKGRHGFLRPLPDYCSERVDEPEGSTAIGKGGVYVTAVTMKEFDLMTGDVVRARVRPPSRNNTQFKCLDVLAVTRANNESCLLFRGVFQAKRPGHGFVRPLSGAPLPESWLADGAYVPYALAERLGLKDGQRVVARVKPPQPPANPSATVVEIVREEEISDVAEGEEDEEVPAELAELCGFRLHGTVLKAVTRDAGLNFGFIRVDHEAVTSHVFFHWSSVRTKNDDGNAVIPDVGQGVFFRLEARRDQESRREWELHAVNVNFADPHGEAAAGASQQDARERDQPRAPDRWSKPITRPPTRPATLRLDARPAPGRGAPPPPALASSRRSSQQLPPPPTRPPPAPPSQPPRVSWHLLKRKPQPLHPVISTATSSPRKRLKPTCEPGAPDSDALVDELRIRDGGDDADCDAIGEWESDG